MNNFHNTYSHALFEIIKSDKIGITTFAPRTFAPRLLRRDLCAGRLLRRDLCAATYAPGDFCAATYAPGDLCAATFAPQ
uniref:Uncharacterized protein n=1 Tax=Meloidogyne incognita TaxID=6306 RepID=A0A914P382_MELIC